MDDDLPAGMHELEKKHSGSYCTGCDISAFSVDELDSAINLLKVEITRLEDAKIARNDTKSEAEALFRR